jgi:hypothetical protein
LESVRTIFSAGPLVVAEHAVGESGELLAAAHLRVHVERDHVAPLAQVILARRRELVLPGLRPAMQVLHAAEADADARRFRQRLLR